jgi:peroxiredoxin (alkyl hydroperoxide reductase subunit C)
VLEQLEAAGATLYGVSCDSSYSQKAFRERLGVRIQQLSDFEPKGETCRALGVYHRGGFPQRALVIVGPDAVVRWSYQAASPSELPGANLIFDGLAAEASAASPASGSAA